MNRWKLTQFLQTFRKFLPGFFLTCANWFLINIHDKEYKLVGSTMLWRKDSFFWKLINYNNVPWKNSLL